MPATVEDYLDIVQKAYQGSLKLPAFQRRWRWKPKQVRLLFDSLRQGFPIGSFLFIKEAPDVKLAPREFHSSAPTAASTKSDALVLDGQQRITAGLELFYGKGDIKYFIDIDCMHRLFQEKGCDIKNDQSIRDFLNALETEDNYCVAKRGVKDPHSLLLKSHLLWTATLIEPNELKRAVKVYGQHVPEREEFVDFVIATNFVPRTSSNIPITVIDGVISAEGITRIFSTLNSTGKMLTPFELVVAVLYPDNIELSDDVDVAKATFPYYSRIDPSGDILLQTIALFSDQETRKAFFPKTITASRYRLHFNDAVKYLDQAGQILTHMIGLGLDASSELLVYPVIFPPMAYVLKWMDGQPFTAPERASAERKLARWFIGAVLSRRYQQSTHYKQAKDKELVPNWIKLGDEAEPAWLKDVFIPNLKRTIPSGATGKLVRSLLNARGLTDPFTQKPVGVGSGKQTSASHHIFPTKFVPSLGGWTKEDSANRVLNIMYTEESTNGSWLNLDPALQVSKSADVIGLPAVQAAYERHAISSDALKVLQRPFKSKADFDEFLELREASVVSLLKQWGFVQPSQPTEDADDELDDE